MDMSDLGELSSIFHFEAGCLSIEHGDGKLQLLPQGVLSHSKLLRDVFGSGDSGNAPLRLSMEQVHDWLSFINAEEVVDSKPQSPTSDATLINILQAADVLIDEATMAIVTGAVADIIIQPLSGTNSNSTLRPSVPNSDHAPLIGPVLVRKRPRDVESPEELSLDLHQILEAISDDLAISVLRCTNASFPNLLAVVPGGHHPLALRALCPSIDANLSLVIAHTDATAALNALIATSALTQLVSLSCHQQLLPAGAFVSAFSCLRHLPGLQRLDISEMRVRADGAPALAEPLAHLTSLQDLNIDMTYISDEGMCTLASAMMQLHQLTSLRMMMNRIGNTGAEALTVPLANLKELRCLVLDINDIDEKGIAALVPALCQLLALTNLSLSGNSMGAMGADSLASALTCLTSLQALDIEGNNIEQAGALALADSLQTLHMLRCLKLSMNHVCVKGCIALAPVITAPSVSGLVLLDLSRNHICDGGCTAIATALAAMPSLASLNLWWNFITAEGISNLAEELPARSNTMTYLDIGGNQFGDRGAQSLAVGISSMTALETLKIERCKLHVTGIAVLAESLSGLPMLKTLDLSDNRFVADAAAMLPDVLGSLQESISELELTI